MDFYLFSTEKCHFFPNDHQKNGALVPDLESQEVFRPTC